jgi:hypothetical protein
MHQSPHEKLDDLDGKWQLAEATPGDPGVETKQGGFSQDPQTK